jgi:hypothetical protein
MARSDKVKGPKLDRDRKIKKLTKMIKSKERELELVEVKGERARLQVSKGDMSKGDYRRLNIALTRDRKAVRGAITRLEKVRLNRERKLKEKALELEEKLKDRTERRKKRAEERERKRESKDD